MGRVLTLAFKNNYYFIKTIR